MILCSIGVESFQPEDGGCMVLWNVGILPQYYTASQPRRTCHENHKSHIIYYYVYRLPPLNPILSQLNLDHTLKFSFFKIHFIDSSKVFHCCLFHYMNIMLDIVHSLRCVWDVGYFRSWSGDSLCSHLQVTGCHYTDSFVITFFVSGSVIIPRTFWLKPLDHQGSQGMVIVTITYVTCVVTIILPSVHSSPKWSLPLQFSD